MDGTVRTDFYPNPTIHFTPVAPPPDRDRWLQRAFSGYEFFLHPIVTDAYVGRPWDDPSDVTAMQLFVRVSEEAPARDVWYELDSDPMDPEGQALLFVQRGARADYMAISPKPQKKQTGPDSLDDWMQLRPATPDPHIPLFSIADWYNVVGANTGGTVENDLLIDLRSGTPTVRAAEACSEWGGGGVCGAPDMAAQRYEDTTCTWQERESDFLCTTTGPWGGQYNLLNARRQFYMLRGGAPAQLSWAPDALLSLNAFVRKFQNAASGRALVKGVGYVDLVWTSHSILPQKRVLLLASAGSGNQDNARFTLAVVGADGAASLIDVPKWSIGGEASDDAKSPADFTPSDDNIHVSATEFAQAAGAHLLRAVYRRKGTDATVHVVYLVGVQADGNHLVTNAVRLASDGSQYQDCGVYLNDSTALQFNWTAASRMGTVLVQPARPSERQPNQPRACSWQGALRWVDGVGFRVRKDRDLCGLPDRTVVIDDKGAITYRTGAPKTPR